MELAARLSDAAADASDADESPRRAMNVRAHQTPPKLTPKVAKARAARPR